MTDYTFTLRFLSPIEDLDELSILLYDQMVDASLSGPDEDGSFLLEFDKRASSLPSALTSAIKELLKLLPQAQILRVEEDDLATMADIAKRSGRTPESVRLLVNGKRGPGGFPRPPGGSTRGRRSGVGRMRPNGSQGPSARRSQTRRTAPSCRLSTTPSSCGAWRTSSASSRGGRSPPSCPLSSQSLDRSGGLGEFVAKRAIGAQPLREHPAKNRHFGIDVVDLDQRRAA